MGGSPPLRREKTGRKGAALDSSVQFLEGQGDVHSQLRAILVENQVRIIDLFRDWDADGDGKVSKKEFRQALQVLGLEASRRTEADALFDTYDPDRSGQIDYGELSKAFTRFSSPLTLTLTLTLTLKP